MMETVQIVLTIPADLARDAEDVGLLEADAILGVLRESVDQRIMEMVNADIFAKQREQLKLTPEQLVSDFLAYTDIVEQRRKKRLREMPMTILCWRVPLAANKRYRHRRS